ncbi:MAG: HAD hydrolase-like protein [Planctomycetes bacterium]|nr:HAD hydrolase-like protein [Planctomycetota bacterium]
MVDLVVFDMAGTTVYDGDAVSDSFRAALSAVGVVPDPIAVNNVMGLHKPEAIRILLAAAGRTVSDQVVDAIHADFVQRMTHYYKTDPAVREVPGAAAVFRQLRAAGIKVALNSGFSRGIVDVILDRLGWTHAIDASVASDEVPKGRPDPAMIRTLMQKLNLQDAGRVAKVGDTPVDLAEGFAAGCGVVIGVTTGSFSRAQLEEHRHTRILDSVILLPDLLLHAPA